MKPSTICFIGAGIAGAAGLAIWYLHSKGQEVVEVGLEETSSPDMSRSPADQGSGFPGGAYGEVAPPDAPPELVAGGKSLADSVGIFRQTYANWAMQ